MRDTAALIIDALDPPSRQRLYAVSRTVQRLLIPHIHSLRITIPKDHEWAKRAGQLRFLPDGATSLLLTHQLTLAPCMDRQGAKGGMLEERNLSAFLDFLSFRLGGSSALPHCLRICRAVLGGDLSRKFASLYGNCTQLQVLYLDHCTVLPGFFSCSGLQHLRALKLHNCSQFPDRPHLGMFTGAKGTSLLSLTVDEALTHPKPPPGMMLSKFLLQRVHLDPLLSTFPLLQTLELPRHHIVGSAVEALAWRCPRLTAIAVYGLVPGSDLSHFPCSWKKLRITGHLAIRDMSRLPLRFIDHLAIDPWLGLRTMMDSDTTQEEAEAAVDNLLACPGLPESFPLILTKDGPWRALNLVPLRRLRGRVHSFQVDHCVSHSDKAELDTSLGEVIDVLHVLPDPTRPTYHLGMVLSAPDRFPNVRKVVAASSLVRNLNVILDLIELRPVLRCISIYPDSAHPGSFSQQVVEQWQEILGDQINLVLEEEEGPVSGGY